MPLSYVLDENLRGVLWRAVQRHNLRKIYPIDVVRVGDPSDLPLGTADPDLLVWAERTGRILVSLDLETLPQHLADHLRTGNLSPGIFLVRPNVALAEVLEYLVLAAYASDPAEWRDRCAYIPC